ncbi:hypothetical protein JAAARDRAFT_31462 [Jaapia argillacea MUCL 33604]|uniref:J domain-containing protein n=1 Tax=Jaapia argillacea MUCL 33604 TaxID=933084 RepID=A0A067Q752_9AGAM|nr:hypothetical protein JAAARDRAFT_31462 [Jaapia argillacea MUCL 33604]
MHWHPSLATGRLNLHLLPSQIQVLVHVRLASTANVGADTSSSADAERHGRHKPHHHHVPYPFPTHPNPTPHQIFHLPVGASQSDIKSRYYDLVRIHHPDSPTCRSLLPSPTARHERFQKLTSAYEHLRFPTAHSSRIGRYDSARHGYGYEEEIERRRRHQWARERNRSSGAWSGAHHYRGWQEQQGRGWGAGLGGAEAYGEWNATGDDRWKDRVIVAVGLLSLVLGLAPTLFLNPYSYVDQRHLAAAANLAQARKEAREYGMERRKEIKKRVSDYRRLREGEEDGDGKESCPRREEGSRRHS